MLEQPSTSASSDRASRREAGPVAKALAGLAALAVAMGIGRFAFTPILPMMLQDAGLSIASGGLLASANYLGYLLGALSAMVVRIRPEHAIRGGLLSIAAVTLAMSLKLPFAVWLVLRLLAGMASAWVLISVSAWCMESLARYQRPFLNSLVFAGVGTGIATAGLMCLALIQADAPSAHAWASMGLVSLAVTAIAWRFFRPASATSAARAGHARYQWNADAVRLVICYGVFGFGYIIPATFLPVMARNALQGSPLFGWSWPVFGLAAAVSTLWVAFLVGRMGNRRLWRLSHFVMAAGVVLPVVVPGLLSVFVAAVCVGRAAGGKATCGKQRDGADRRDDLGICLWTDRRTAYRLRGKRQRQLFDGAGHRSRPARRQRIAAGTRTENLNGFERKRYELR